MAGNRRTPPPQPNRRGQGVLGADGYFTAEWSRWFANMAQVVDETYLGSRVYVQQNAPGDVPAGVDYMWWETDGAGSLVTLWVETNGS